ncbi:MAG TPA: hypothetical protein PKA88_31265 [Polyangiaceae bacterium]|nr:hypothetical protein [Polyangiaceae bacterium]HMR76110.1 hypothetical protein [Polyangiaceae bacterium]
MTDPDELAQALLTLAAAFEAMGVTWAIGGSLASAAHGEPRSTNDVDVIARLDEKSARLLTERLQPTFYADESSAVEAVRGRGSFNVIDNRSILKIDIFVPADGPLGVGQLDRRRLLELFTGVPAFPVLGPEDTVLQKLRWYQLGGEISDRQWRDITSVLRHAATEIDNGGWTHLRRDHE